MSSMAFELLLCGTPSIPESSRPWQ